jgi:glycosyltransferase involved in cell wall biosynthesis
MSLQPCVLIVQPIITHYRLKLYLLLEECLLQKGIRLQVVYGAPNQAQEAKQDFVDLPASIGLKVKNFWFLDGKVLYQPIIRQALSADLVIVLNANGYLVNYPLSFLAFFKIARLGFWVWWKQIRHSKKSIAEWARRHIMRQGLWWFAYTAGTKQYLLQDGMPSDRITVLNNSIDMTGFRASLAQVTKTQMEHLLTVRRMPNDAKIGLFCGSLYAEKRLDFLVTAVELIRALQPDFQLLIIGDGVQRDKAYEAAAFYPGIHYLGPLFDHDKAVCFRLAHVFLCPGLIGLAILDAFAAGLPLITTAVDYHSPEIDYLLPGINGLITNDNVTDYANAVADVLANETELEKLKKGAAHSARHYSIEAMAESFAEGIASCLNRK